MTAAAVGSEMVGPVVTGDVVPDEAATVPPMLAGTFAIYPTPDGGFALVTDIIGRGQERRIVSGKMVKLVTSGIGARMFGGLFGPGEGT